MSNPIHQIQSELHTEIKKIPMVKNSIGDSGAIPVHMWRGSNLTNQLEAALKKVGFGIVIKVLGFNQTEPKHWQGNLRIEIQANDNFNFGGWGKGVAPMDVAWSISEMMANFGGVQTSSPFKNISTQTQEDPKNHIEKILITARIEWWT